MGQTKDKFDLKLSPMEKDILSIIAIYFPFSPDDVVSLYRKTHKSYDFTILLCEIAVKNGLGSSSLGDIQVLERFNENGLIYNIPGSNEWLMESG